MFRFTSVKAEDRVEPSSTTGSLRRSIAPLVKALQNVLVPDEPVTGRKKAVGMGHAGRPPLDTTAPAKATFDLEPALDSPNVGRVAVEDRPSATANALEVAGWFVHPSGVCPIRASRES
jgi:hypothetical protein